MPCTFTFCYIATLSCMQDFVGTIDEMRVWSMVRTPDQIREVCISVAVSACICTAAVAVQISGGQASSATAPNLTIQLGARHQGSQQAVPSRLVSVSKTQGHQGTPHMRHHLHAASLPKADRHGCKTPPCPPGLQGMKTALHADGAAEVKQQQEAVSKDDRNLVAWWDFEEGEGYLVKDITGHGHDLHLLQEPRWQVGVAKRSCFLHLNSVPGHGLELYVLKRSPVGRCLGPGCAGPAEQVCQRHSSAGRDPQLSMQHCP